LPGREQPYTIISKAAASHTFIPLPTCAILMLVNYLVVRLTGMHYYDTEELRHLTTEQAQIIVEYDATQWWFLEHTYLYMLIAIPACSIFLYLFFRAFRFRFNLAECAVILMFIIAQGVLIQSALYLLTGWIHHGAFIRTVEAINGVFLLSYASYALFDMVKPRRRKFLAGLACTLGDHHLVVDDCISLLAPGPEQVIVCFRLCQPPTANRQLPTANCQPITAYWLPAVQNFPLTTGAFLGKLAGNNKAMTPKEFAQKWFKTIDAGNYVGLKALLAEHHQFWNPASEQPFKQG
jgi:hypothetical protein